MPRVPTPYDTAAPTVDGVRSVAQIDDRVAARIGSAGHQIGNAVSAIGSMFGEIADRSAVANDQTAEGRAKLDWYKFDNEAWQGLAKKANEDGSSWDGAGAVYDQGRNDILSKYPISDPKRREALNLFLEHQVAERGFRAGREKTAAQSKYYIGIENQEIDGAAAKVEADPSQATVDAMRSGLHVLVDGGKDIYHSEAGIAQRKKEIENALTMALWKGLVRDKPDAAMELRRQILGGQYQIDNPSATGGSGPGQSAGGGSLPLGSLSSIDDVPSAGKSPKSRDFGYGVRRTENGDFRNHAGLDIPGKVGEPALAVSDGTIVKMGLDQNGYGPFVDIQYADGTIHRVAHLGNTDKGGEQKPFADGLKVGSSVKAGDTLGYLGYGGNAGEDFPHLHYEVFKNKAAYDAGGSKPSREGLEYRLAPKEYFSSRQGGSPASAGGGATPKLTAYSPQAGGDKMEGGYASSKPGPDGKAEVRTLEDYAAGRSKYITVAGDPSQYGKNYTIPKIEWIDSQGKTQTSTNVPVVVHDTGPAFKGAGNSRFDIPVARDLSNEQMNKQPFLKGGVKFVDGGSRYDAAIGILERGGKLSDDDQKTVAAAVQTAGITNDGVDHGDAQDAAISAISKVDPKLAERIAAARAAGKEPDASDQQRSLEIIDKSGLTAKPRNQNLSTALLLQDALAKSNPALAAKVAAGATGDALTADEHAQIQQAGSAGDKPVASVLDQLKAKARAETQAPVAERSIVHGRPSAKEQAPSSPFVNRITELAASAPDTKLNQAFTPEEVTNLVKRYPAIGEIVGSEAAGQLTVGDIGRLVRTGASGNPADDPIARIKAMAADKPDAPLTDVFDAGQLAEFAKKVPAIAQITDLHGTTVGDAARIFKTFEAAHAQSTLDKRDVERIGGRLVPGQTFTVDSKNGPISLSADAINGLDRKTLLEMSGLTVEAKRVRDQEQKSIADDMMRKQLATIEMTGKDHTSYNEQALKTALAKNPKALANFQHKTEIARTVFKATDNAVNLPNDVLDDRVRALNDSVLSAAGDVDPDTQAAFARASKRVEALKSLRERDPARAVQGSTEVKAALDNIPNGEPKNKAQLFQLADATMKAQARLGMPQVPINKSTAQAIMDDIINAPESKKMAVAAETARKVHDTYGTLAEQVLASSAKLARGDNDDDRRKLTSQLRRVDRESMNQVDGAVSGKTIKRGDQLPKSNPFDAFGSPQ